MGFLDRVFRRRIRDLSTVEGPTRVELRCEVTSPQTTRSPVSGRSAALIAWRLMAQRSRSGDTSNNATETLYDVLSSGLYGPDTLSLSHEGERLEVPLAYARLALVEDPRDGQLLSPVPPELAEAVERLRTDKPIAYREAFLLQGDSVSLEATVERVSSAGSGYRDRGAGPTFRAALDEPIVIRDLT
ncbi:MAG: hypothetical protein VYE22_25795 [Myxococcota bacterium]|nr:hypothetical protein [Myxococcota bacterium]